MDEKLINGMTADEYLENLEAELFTESHYESLATKAISHARTLLVHILKLIYQNDKQDGSWCGSIIDSHVDLYTALLNDKKNGFNRGEINLYKNNFYVSIVPNAIKWASIETGLPKSSFELIYGISPRSLIDTAWILHFINTFVTDERLLKNTLNPNTKHMKRLNALPKINSNDIKYIDKELGKVEYE